MKIKRTLFHICHDISKLRRQVFASFIEFCDKMFFLFIQWIFFSIIQKKFISSSKKKIYLSRFWLSLSFIFPWNTTVRPASWKIKVDKVLPTDSRIFVPRSDFPVKGLICFPQVNVLQVKQLTPLSLSSLEKSRAFSSRRVYTREPRPNYLYILRWIQCASFRFSDRIPQIEEQHIRRPPCTVVNSRLFFQWSIPSTKVEYTQIQIYATRSQSFFFFPPELIEKSRDFLSQIGFVF